VLLTVRNLTELLKGCKRKATQGDSALRTRASFWTAAVFSAAFVFTLGWPSKDNAWVQNPRHDLLLNSPIAASFTGE